MNEKVISNLAKNGIEAEVVSSREEALNRIKELVPEGAEVMTMQSVTLKETGIAELIDNSGKYDSIRNKLKSMNRETQNSHMQKLGAAPDYAIGSVHAITEDGHLFIASNTGSQLPAYAYGAQHVIWIVGKQKIVKDDNEAVRRIYDYVLPLESKRLSEDLGKDIKSNVSKLLIINKEVKPGRARVILVEEDLGF